MNCFRNITPRLLSFIIAVTICFAAVPAFAENSTSLLNGNIDKNLVKETAAAGAAFPAGAAVAIACAAAVIALGGVITVFVVIRKRRRAKKQ